MKKFSFTENSITMEDRTDGQYLLLEISQKTCTVHTKKGDFISYLR